MLATKLWAAKPTAIPAAPPNANKLVTDTPSVCKMDSMAIIKIVTQASLLIASAAVGSMWSFLASARALKLTSKRLINRNENQLSVRRSEEHTSELQSRPHLVCRLLLAKKND